MKFYLKKDVNWRYFFILLSRNGQTVGVSESYNTRAGALRGIAACRRAALRPGAMQFFVDANGQHRFRLRARNGRILLASEGYLRTRACKRTAARIMVGLPGARSP